MTKVNTRRALKSGPTPSVLTLVFCLLWVAQSSAQSSTIVFHVSEELPSGTEVGSVKEASNITAEVAADEVDRLLFQIFSADGLRITSIFNINSKTGVLFTNAMIDREQMCPLEPVCRLEFDVTVNNGPSFVRLLSVAVIVDDINDNAPAFPKREITLSVPESAPVDSEIPISGALDSDSGIDTTIRYSLQMSSVFRLEEVKQLDGTSALKLVVQRELDREAVSTYNFLILASDGGGGSGSGNASNRVEKTGTLTVNVVVTDVNDNVPTFSKETFNLTVMETAPVGTVFGHLTATDGDIGDNGDLAYRFSLLTQADVTDLFSLNATSGELTVASDLQYQSERTFQCVVEVMDKGIPPRVSQALLRVHVADAGNTPPKLALILAEPVYGDQSAMLSEDAPPGTFVGTLRVEDLDDGPEGRVTCLSQDPHFSLQDLDSSPDASRYWIVVSRPLDREQQREMRVTLLCSDSGDPALTSSTVFKVILRDVNDNSPRFSRDVYSAALPENGVGQQSVTRVEASDLDDGSNGLVTYSLDARSSGLFSIDTQTGWITTTHSFDRELTPFFSLTVYAVDAGDLPLNSSALVSVKIFDVNDNAPYVNRTDYYVSENVPVGHVFPLSVMDQDEGINGEVVTALMSKSPSLSPSGLPLSVLTNGSVQVVRQLDREQKSLYVLPISLTDQGSPAKSATATLTVHVIDSNDHAPEFLFPTPGNSSVHVVAEIPVGSHVCQLGAVDMDKGSNGQVTYGIAEGNNDQWFGINNQTGEIFVIKALLATAGRTLHLRVSASDFGQPRLTALTYLDIYVRATNGSLGHQDGAGDQDTYVIIAGVIAGVTIIVAIVVIAVIVHMRNSDLRRREAQRQKAIAASQNCSLDNAKNLNGVLCKPVPVSEASNGGSNGKTVTTTTTMTTTPAMKNNNNGVKFTSNGGESHNVFVSRGDGGGFDSPTVSHSRGDDFQLGAVLTEREEDSVDRFNPSFSFFPEPPGAHRLSTEDHNSDTSGETTTCDSGRGASDEEVVFSSPGKSTVSSTDPPPRIPPRHPIAGHPNGQWTQDARLLSTNWSHLQQPPPHYFSDPPPRYGVEEEALESPDPSVSKASVRKGQLRVRFSVGDCDVRLQQQNSPSRSGVDNSGFSTTDAMNPRFDTTNYANSGSGDGGPRSSLRGQRHQPSYGSSSHGDRIASGPADPRYSQQQLGTFSGPFSLSSSRPGSGYHSHGGQQGPETHRGYPPSSSGVRLNPESLYPRHDNKLHRKQPGAHLPPGWERQPGKARNSDSLSSLPHSVEDDVSTTTSGSYSIDLEDVGNGSLEC